MKTYDVQTIEINATFDRVFSYLADPRTLPEWTSAFQSITQGKAVMATPNGSLEVGLEVQAARDQGTVDWIMTFPDGPAGPNGNVARANSRIIRAADQNSCLYSFVLLPPPVPLEQLEGALEAQSRILREELAKLSAILSSRR